MDFIVQKKKKELKRYLLLIFFLTLLVLSAFLGWINSTNGYDSFSSTITNSTQIVVFYQPNCPHCIAELPTVRKLSKSFNVTAINILTHREYISKYNITATPTILLIKGNYERIVVGDHSYKEIVKQYNNITKFSLFNSGSCSITKHTCG